MSMHHGTIALSCIDDEDIFLGRAEEILKPYGGRLKALRLADNGDFELSFEVPESSVRATNLLLCRLGLQQSLALRGKVVRR